MADVLHRITKQFLRSVNTPAYDPADWIINPDLSKVENVSTRYWKIIGDTVSEMSQAEKDAVDVSIEQARIAFERQGAKDEYERRLWKAFALVVLDEINLLRIEHGLLIVQHPN